MRFRIATSACALVVALAAPAQASDHPANVHWESLLPALPAPKGGKTRVPFCPRSKVACVDATLERMVRLQRQLRCDHRAVFATTYLELTRQIRSDLKGPYKRQLDDKFYLYREVAQFANVYFQTVKDWKRGKPVAGAWRVAFETARSGQVNATQDMLLGINAHVQNDMPYVIAQLGLFTRDGKSGKPDHDRANDVLERAYDRVIDQVAARYDPFVRTTNSGVTPADDVFGLEMVKGWRENVWRNAERLVNARSDEERRQIARQIDANATGWAQGIAAFQTPGDRERRDAYCTERLAR